MQCFRYAKSRVTGHWLADLPNTVQKIGNLRIHMILGALAGSWVIARVVMRRRLPAAPAARGEKLAGAGHVVLNLGILLLAASGLVLAVQSGAFDAVFGNGVLPEDFKVFTLRKLHGLLSRVAMGLVALHVLAALYHQFIVKDGLIARMTFSRK